MKLIDKHGSSLQIDTPIFDRDGQYSQSSQNTKFTMSLQYLQKQVRDEVDF